LGGRGGEKIREGKGNAAKFKKSFMNRRSREADLGVKLHKRAPKSMKVRLTPCDVVRNA